MDVTFAHLCDYATISRENKLSVLGIFSQINALEIPFVHPQAYLAFEVEADYAEIGKPFRIEIEIVGDEGVKIFRAEAELTLQSSPTQPKPVDRPRSEQILPITGLNLKRAGTYDINLFINQRLLKQLRFRVAPIGGQ